MKSMKITISMVVVAFLTGTARADRTLEQTEVSQILRTLTDRPIKTWISSGTISATHEQYRAPKTTDPAEISDRIKQAIQEHQSETDSSQLSEEILKMKLDAIPFNIRYKWSNEYTMNARETVKYDGSRFYWSIDVSSRTDSVKPGSELAGNFMTNEFDMADNRRRAFAWDGSKYTLYSASKNNAFVDAAGELPQAVNGPLTAGIIPWGYGQYTYSNLTILKTSGVEKQRNGQTQIHLTLDRPNGTRMLFVLDADNDYAVIYHSTEGFYQTVSRHYGNHQSVAGVLVPRTIEIETRDAATNRLVSRDSWYITSIGTGAPSTGDFTINYKNDAQIEYSSPLGQTAMYRHSSRLDTDLLLAERLSYAASRDKSKQNCATAALRYAALRLGRNISMSQLAGLADRRTGRTSLDAIMGFIHRQGLFCRAVRTDIQTLQRLPDCQVILHIPHKNHFVLLGDIDSEFIWTIDLADRRFCSRADVAFFGMDWTQGTALLISDRPIDGSLNDIDHGATQTITGGAGYTCTELLQYESHEFCDIMMGICYNSYIYEPERWSCERAESGMCLEDRKLHRASCPCVNDPYDPSACVVNGDWEFTYMMACR
jgi:hypothetical protein